MALIGPYTKVGVPANLAWNLESWYHKRQKSATCVTTTRVDVTTRTQPADSMVGYLNPDYKEQIEQGLNATTPFTAWEYESLEIPGSMVCEVINPPDCFQDRVCYGVSQSGHFARGVLVYPSTGQVSGISTSTADNSARSSLISDWAQNVTAFQGGVFLGELKETMQMLRKPLLTLRKEVSRYRQAASKVVRGIKRDHFPKSARRALAGTWLEAQFGWLPLFSDIANAASAVGKVCEGLTPSVRIRGFGKSQAVVLGSWNGSVNFGGMNTAFRIASVDDSLVVYRALLALDRPQWDAAYWGFDPIRNFLPTLWELCPYSFLIDYFSNAQEMIEALTMLRGEIKWVNRTTVRKRTNRVSDHRISTLPTWGLTGCLRTATIVEQIPEQSALSLKYVVRDTPPSYLPSFRVDLSEFSVRKLLNIAALVAGRAEDRRRAGRTG